MPDHWMLQAWVGVQFTGRLSLPLAGMRLIWSFLCSGNAEKVEGTVRLSRAMDSPSAGDRWRDGLEVRPTSVNRWLLTD